MNLKFSEVEKLVQNYTNWQNWGVLGVFPDSEEHTFNLMNIPPAKRSRTKAPPCPKGGSTGRGRANSCELGEIRCKVYRMSPLCEKEQRCHLFMQVLTH